MTKNMAITRTTKTTRLPIIMPGDMLFCLPLVRRPGRALPSSSSSSPLRLDLDLVPERVLLLLVLERRVLLLPPALDLEPARPPAVFLPPFGWVLPEEGRAAWALPVLGAGVSVDSSASESALRRARSFSFMVGPSRRLRGASSGTSTTFLGGAA